MKWLKKLFKRKDKTVIEQAIDEVKEQQEEERKPVLPNAQIGLTKQECMNCISTGTGSCSTCTSAKKCFRIRRKMKKAGFIR